MQFTRWTHSYTYNRIVLRWVAGALCPAGRFAPCYCKFILELYPVATLPGISFLPIHITSPFTSIVTVHTPSWCNYRQGKKVLGIAREQTRIPNTNSYTTVTQLCERVCLAVGLHRNGNKPQSKRMARDDIYLYFVGRFFFHSGPSMNLRRRCRRHCVWPFDVTAALVRCCRALHSHSTARRSHYEKSQNYSRVTRSPSHSIGRLEFHGGARARTPMGRGGV